MAFPSLLSLAFLFLALSHHVCFSQLELGQQQQQQQLQDQQLQQEDQQHSQWQWRGMGGGQQHRLRAKTDCGVQRISSREPNRRIESDGGLTEVWDSNNSEEFQCAGVAAVRHVIQPRGLLLPSYTNAPQIYYVIQGRGIQGTVIPGCPETYESGSQSGSQYDKQERQRSQDRHQKIRQLREGDIIALPVGVAHWAYNDGESPLIFVSLIDLGNDANQLDLNFRKFFLAGNPLRQQQELRRLTRRGEQEQGQNAGNVFNGFDEEMLADIFNVDIETARKLQGQDDQRGNIVRVERNLRVISPQFQEEEQERERERGWERERRGNGLAAICSVRLRENIGNPDRADVYNPRGGRVSNLNGHNLPILNWVQLSAERGVLYRNAILAPHWNINAHSIIYVLRGSGRIQIVGNSGRSVFDEHVQEGRIIIVPQNFAVIKKASNEGFEWIAFKTNNNAKIQQLAGRVSAIRSMPEEVLMNSYDISRDDARNLKYNREEVTVFSPGSRSQREN